MSLVACCKLAWNHPVCIRFIMFLKIKISQIRENIE
jgi:hypothetical protein